MECVCVCGGRGGGWGARAGISLASKLGVSTSLANVKRLYKTSDIMRQLMSRDSTRHPVS